LTSLTIISSTGKSSASLIMIIIIIITRNSLGDEIANVNFLYGNIVHALQNTIGSFINYPQINTVMCWNKGLPNTVK